MADARPSSPQTESGAARRRHRAAAEILGIVGLILTIIWVVKPLGRPALDVWLRVLAGALLLGSPVAHHDSRARLGLRFDTFAGAAARLSPMTLLAAAVATGAGYVLVSIDPPPNAAVELTYYFVWAAAQQYALQAVILLRLEDMGLRAGSPVAASAIFSLVHAPNPGLMILTFLGGLLWCSTFRKYPNIPALALSHAVLAVVVVSTLPREVTGGFRIGPEYLRPG